MKRLFLTTSTIVVTLLFAFTGYSEIADDVQKGLALSQVINNALNSGKPVETIVPEAIDAGADPVSVVLAAINLRPSLAAIIVNAALKKRPDMSVGIVKTALGLPRVDAASVVTAAVTAVSGDAQTVTNLRFAALEAGVPQNVVNQAIGTAIGAPAGPVPTPTAVGTGERGGYGGGSGGGQGPVASPWR